MPSIELIAPLPVDRPLFNICNNNSNPQNVKEQGKWTWKQVGQVLAVFRVLSMDIYITVVFYLFVRFLQTTIFTLSLEK